MFFRRIPPLEDEAELFQRVETWRNNISQTKTTALYDAVFFEKLTAEKGLDFATAFLFHHLTHHPRYAEAIWQIQEFQKREELAPIAKEAIVALIPGAFYGEHPETGADGQTIRETATQLGFQAELVPVQSVGSLTENAQIICDWLHQQPSVPIILVS
ncbi:MAG: hypothetical protein KDA84_23265, partial [Planctomycetaceae bacterium]|nr:hypothetical protein [Planctomycetaceae bacterium]